mgnify:CR=1 FL=1
MTTSVLLIRHAAHGDLGERLTGRGPEGGLSARGREQAAALADQLSTERLAAVYASPRLRTRQTAEVICGSAEVQVADQLDEVDFGDWTGAAFAELEGDPVWERWNSERSVATVPRGETMAEAQERAWRFVQSAARRHDGETIALVTHCDIIRALVACVLGLSLDHILSFDTDPASVTRLAVGEWGAKLVSLNERVSA